MYGNRNFGGPRRGGFSPVQVGQELDVKIEAVGEKGDGIAKEKGFVLFVPGTKEGDEVRIKVTKVLRNVGFAETVGEAEGPVEEPETQPEAETSESEDFGEAQDTEPEKEPQEEETDTEDFGEEEEPAEESKDEENPEEAQEEEPEKKE
ncbi:TRAM domain-containing protein [Candidatus Woesearchaeota archaeon]|nr:TRAM domain-containing protein [Candidatus Woesearchaeota archaeon]